MTKTQRVRESDPIKLGSQKPKEIYSAGKVIKCVGCGRMNPSKRMYRYHSTSRGQVILCETYDEDAEVRSFCKLDALDRPRKKIKLD